MNMHFKKLSDVPLQTNHFRVKKLRKWGEYFNRISYNRMSLRFGEEQWTFESIWLKLIPKSWTVSSEDT
jgi:hypothetical protein